MSRAGWLLVTLLLLGAPTAQAAAPGELQVKTSLSRTALWPGDRVLYTLEIACAPHVDVVTDDLLPEKLALTGLELVSSEHQRSEDGGGALRYVVRHQLASYDVAAPKLAIGEQSVRYYVRRAGQRLEEAAPAGEVRVPGSALALRSTLPDELPRLATRDARGPEPLPAALLYARPVGLLLVLLSAAPVALLVLGLARRAHATRSRGRRRQRESSSSTRSALQALRDLDVQDAGARRDAFSRLDALLRQHLAVAAELPARALTAAELAARLRANGKPLPADSIGALLLDCERARFGPPDRLPPAERFHAGLLLVEELLEPPR